MIAVGPEASAAARECAERALAEGDVATVARLYEGLRVADLSGDERACWCLLLVEAGELELARALSASLEAEARARVLALLAEPADPVVAGADPTSSEREPAGDCPEDELDLRGIVADPGSIERRLAEQFIEWFGGRRDIYSRQWHDERRGRSGYHPVREPLTLDVAAAHLSGRTTLGQYVLFPDATVANAVIDLDLSGSALAELRASYGDEVTALRHDVLRAYLRRLLEAGRCLGLPLFPEDSGGKGAHLWIFFAPRRTARAARALLGQVVMAAGPQPAEVGLELFPKQDALGPRGLSSLVKLPLGVHQGSLRRCPMLDDELRPIDDPAAALGRLRRADPALVDAIVGRRVVALPAPELERAEQPPPLPTTHTPRSLAELLRAVGGGAEARRAAEQTLSRCPVLAALVKKAYDERRLQPDEARAIIYTIGLIGARNELVEGVLAAAGASFKELERARRGLPSPAGCRRLRPLGAPGASCDGCWMSARALPYATPVLAIFGDVAPAPPRHAPFAPWLEGADNVVQGPFEAIGDALRRIEGRLEQLEQLERRGEPGTGGCEPFT